MARKFITFMVIPHNEDRVREVNCSRLMLYGSGAAILVFLVSFVVLGYGFLATLGVETAHKALAVENAELETHLGRIQGSLTELRGQIEDLTRSDRQMRAYTSLAEPGGEVRQMGVGGVEAPDAPWENRVSLTNAIRLEETYTDLDQLVREARFLESSFDSILATLERNETIRLHTPSIFPVKGEGWPSSSFGYRQDPFTGQRSFHNGMDIAGRNGTPIVAAADGVVDQARYDRRLGHYVSIAHEGGIRTVYGHLIGHKDVKKGQRVVRGDVIGRMGKSGRTTATHLHYGISINGRAVDPSRYILDTRRTRVF
ncbi:MAG: hypothetical protein CME26_11710 [Gemmatimonadetes bacterium]|nr:hypothetical protein [Gemmatimonadota bacterium]|tara:strand:- start:1755 stop:2693 length:939 start_codon:yes stop_codon:yes gene_type:complete